MAITLSEETWSETVGFVGDYCIVCDEPSAFVLIAHKHRTRVSGIGLGAHTTAHEVMCTSCNTPFKRKRRKHGYAAVLEDIGSLESLMGQTTPDYEERHRARIERMNLAASGGGGAPERADLIVETMRELRHAWRQAPKLERKRDYVRPLLFAGSALVAVLAALALPMSMLLAGTGFVASVGLFALLGVRARRERIRLAREVILPRLAMALRRLRPTEGELQTARRRARRRLPALRYLNATEIATASAEAAAMECEDAVAGQVHPEHHAAAA